MDDVVVNDGGMKRRKLNLLKCRQCREARKRCTPEGRVWPQKCDRCRQHSTNELECSEPLLNIQSKKRKLLDAQLAHKLENEVMPDDNGPRNIAMSGELQHQGTRGAVESSLDDDISYERPARTEILARPSQVPESDTFSRFPASGMNILHPTTAYLPLEMGQFRILQLSPGRKDEKAISCSFTTASIEEPLRYETVSYLWGGGSTSKRSQDPAAITLIDSQGLGHSIFISQNVHDALRALRHPKLTRFFWVDALCVNHSNVDERTGQAVMKQNIFYRANNLCLWLGKSSAISTALDFTPRILNLARVDNLVRDPVSISGWLAFQDLLRHPIFTRLWLVQEVSLARNITIHSGQQAIHYNDFVDAVAIFISRRTELASLFRSAQKKFKGLSDQKIKTTKLFLDISINSVQITQSGPPQRQLTLESLVSQLSDLNCSDPRDRVYSVLALAKDSLGPVGRCDSSIRLDYCKTIHEVYQDFILHVIDRSQSLNIILRPWTISLSDLNLPTWIRPLQFSVQHLYNSHNSDQRTNADSLVGLPNQSYYNASGNKVANIRRGPGGSLPGDVQKSLIVTGTRMDQISKLGPRAEGGVIMREWLEIGGCVDINSEPDISEKTLEFFWRTLVANRGPEGSNAPTWYGRAFTYCLHLCPNGNINPSKLIKELEAQGSFSLVVDFLERVNEVVWNRKFLLSEDHKWIGLAPTAAQIGDCIFILRGCSVPVLLRFETAETGQPFYQVVGECYVHGLMDGEEREVAGRFGNVEEQIELI